MIRREPRLPQGPPKFPKPKDMAKPRNLAVKIFPDGREVCFQTAAGKREYRLRTIKMVNRQKGICPKCCKSMSLLDFSFQHGDTRGMGGGRRNDDINAPGNCAMHIQCNGELGSRRTI